MTGALLSAPDQGLLQRVLAYQHEPLVARLQKDLEISEEQARQIFEDTKRFLFICGTCPGKWSPSREIDEGWHNFIMFTKDYAGFCDQFFGRFIHHSPGVSKSESFPTLLGTRQKAQELFGELSSSWDVESSVCSNGCCDNEGDGG